MGEKFNPETHRADFEKAEEEVKRQLTNAHEAALKDNETLDEVRGREITNEQPGQLSEDGGLLIRNTLELQNRIEEVKSEASIDDFFAEGAFQINVTPELKEKLKDLPTALAAFREAGGEQGSILRYFREGAKIDFITPESNLNLVVLSYNTDTRKSTDEVLADMEKLNLLPATIAELIALGIVKSELCKQLRGYALGLGTVFSEEDGPYPYVPLLTSGWGESILSANGVGGQWDKTCRFVCLYK